MSEIILDGYILIPEESLESVKAELPRHIALTREERGCLLFEVIPDTSNKCIYRVYEKFTNRASFNEHQDRVKKSQWGSITTNVERHYTISEDS